MVKDQSENKVWRKLYDLMIQIKELCPWKWMCEDDIFVVQDPDTGKTGFVSIMGELGEHKCVGAYMGKEGLYGYWTLKEAGPNTTPEMLLEIPQLHASFEDRSMLHQNDLNIIKQLGLKFIGKQSWPMFRAYHPGYLPWFPDPWEKNFLVHILEQTVIMAKRLRDDPELLKIYNEDEYLIRIPSSGPEELTWKDSVIRIPPQSPQEIPFTINSDDIEKIMNLRPGNYKFEMDLFMLPTAIEDKGSRPLTVYIFMVVDHENGMIINAEMLKAVPSLKEMWSTVPKHLVNILIGSDDCPKELFVHSELLFQLLYPLANRLGMKIKMMEHLEMLDHAKKGILKNMGKM